MLMATDVFYAVGRLETNRWKVVGDKIKDSVAVSKTENCTRVLVDGGLLGLAVQRGEHCLL